MQEAIIGPLHHPGLHIKEQIGPIQAHHFTHGTLNSCSEAAALGRRLSQLVAGLLASVAEWIKHHILVVAARRWKHLVLNFRDCGSDEGSRRRLAVPVLRVLVPSRPSLYFIGTV